MKIIDAATLLQSSPKPINYLVDRLAPLGMAGDVFAPPGEGKSTLLLSLGGAVASACGSWNGLKCASGPVVFLGGERSDVDTFQRDLHRSVKCAIDSGDLTMPQSDSGEDAIWTWDKSVNEWRLTEWGNEVTEHLVKAPPVLVGLDTVLSVARGSEQINNVQQYELGNIIRHWGKMIGTTVLTTTHTNQSSSSSEIDWRLNYVSRAGGNGLPGSFRWLAGLSRLRFTDKLAEKLQIQKVAAENKIIAFGVSKNNEMPCPVWTNDAPALFRMTSEGQMVLLRDGREVYEQVLKAFDDKSSNKSARKADSLAAAWGLEVRDDY